MIAAQTAAKSVSVQPAGTSELRCFTVVTEGRTFGIPVECIQTVFEMVAVTPVPLAPPEVMGLVNLRGKIVTAVSLKRRLRRDPALADPSRLAVGLEHDGESFALIVDEVGDVIALDRSTKVETLPHLGLEGIKIAAVHKLENLILPILDLGWVFCFNVKDER